LNHARVAPAGGHRPAALTCAATGAPVPGKDETAIRLRMAQWVDGYNRGDIPAMLDVLSEDYQEDVQGLPGINDKRGFGRDLSEIFSKYQSHITSVMDQVYTLGDAGFDRGHYVAIYTPKDGGPAITRRGRYMEVWAFEDGVWRVRYVTDIPESAVGNMTAM